MKQIKRYTSKLLNRTIRSQKLVDRKQWRNYIAEARGKFLNSSIKTTILFYS